MVDLEIFRVEGYFFLGAFLEPVKIHFKPVFVFLREFVSGARLFLGFFFLFFQARNSP